MAASPSLRHCEALIALLGAEKVLLPTSAGYNASLSSYFALQASSLRPQCFVTPTAATEVAQVVKTLASNDAGQSCEFAIRSGGHMWVPGASNVQGGVTIDLRGLDTIDISEDGVSTGVGVSWDTLYAKLDPLGLSVVGGRVAGVATGGLTVGGGISHLGPRYGWTCDTVTAFEVVLADGSIVEANEKQNADLFHGLRGGSNNFGIVTRIDLKTFKQGPIWGGSIYNPVSTIDDVVKTFAKLTAAENFDEYASIITGFGYSQSQNLTVIDNELVYTNPQGEEDPPRFEEFLNLPSIYKSTSILDMTTQANNAATSLPPGAAQYMFATTTFLPTEAMIRAAFDAWTDSLQGVRDINGLTWSLSMDPIPPSMYQRGPNSLGLADRKGTLVVCLLTQVWADAADNERVYAATAALVDALEKAARNLQAYDPFLYLPYAAPWQNPIASYGKESVQQLQQVRARVDPTQVFTRLVPGGFKIPS